MFVDPPRGAPALRQEGNVDAVGSALASRQKAIVSCSTFTHRGLTSPS
jgi:hypothetical protein